MAEPVTVPIETDPEALVLIAYDEMRTRVPGWEPDLADAVTWLLRAMAYMIAEGRDVASDVPTAIFRYLGRWLVNLPPVDATRATTTATVTMVDNAGYTVPAGTRFEIRTSGDSGEVFFTPAAMTVAPLSTTGVIDLTAETPGAAGSGLANTLAVRVVEELAFIDTVVLVAVTTGGVDAETDDAYLARLVDELTLLTPRPILPADFSILAKRIASVSRALTIDGYNPGDLTYSNERMVAVAVTGADGLALSSPIKAAVAALLDAMREVNFVVNVMDATYTTFDVDYVLTAVPGYDGPTVKTAVDAALATYLSPMTWGDITTGDATLQTGWLNVSTLRYLELAAAIDRVTGGDYLTALKFGARRAVTGVASTDVLAATAHGFVLDEPVVFRGTTGGAGITAGTTYYARTIAANTFQIAAAPAGAALNFTTDLTAGTVTGMATVDVALPGPAPLPLTGVVNGTVNVP